MSQNRTREGLPTQRRVAAAPSAGDYLRYAITITVRLRTVRNSSRSDPHRLHVDELANPELRQLAPDAALLHAAERQARIRCRHAVDEDVARREARGKLFAPGDIARPKVAAQSVPRAVGQ